MKHLIVLCMTTLLMIGCVQKNPETTETNKPQITKKQKSNVVTDSTTKIEILLDKGGTVICESNENISCVKNKKYLDKITVYRIISNNDSERSTNWIIDTKYPLTKIDTTLLFCGDNGLKKLQYRQGYISAIYE